MIRSFSEWCNAKRINEANDSFVDVPQKKGDFVYFGIHDLSKQYREEQQLPKINPDNLMKKIGQCVNADGVDRTITVYCEKDPFHFGYHKLEDAESRKKRHSKMEDSTHELTLPISSLIDITHLLEDNYDIGENKIWLVIDSKSKFQQDLIKEIRKKEISKRGPDMSIDIDDEDNEEYPHMAIDHHDRLMMGLGQSFKTSNDSLSKRYFYYPED